MIQGRQIVINPHLDSFSLSRLSSIICLQSEDGNKHSVSDDRPEVISWDHEGKFSLDTNGIFFLQRESAIKRIPETGPYVPIWQKRINDGELKIWGLSRNNEWLLVTVHFVGKKGNSVIGDCGRETAWKVEIREVDISTISDETGEKYQVMWKKLGEAIKSFAARRKSLYEAAAGLAESVEREEYFFSFIPIG